MALITYIRSAPINGFGNVTTTNLLRRAQPVLAATAFCLGIGTVPALAQTFSGSFVNPTTGQLNTATAAFSVLSVGTDYFMRIVLTNTSTFASWGNNDLLNGVFWAMAGSPTLTPSSATTGPLIHPELCNVPATCSAATVNIGGEYGFQYSAAGYSGAIVTSAQYGIGASGYAQLTPAFGAGQTSYFGVSPPNLAGPTNNVGGPDFSILSSSYNAAGSTNAVNNVALVNNSVDFRLLLPVGITTINISNVTFAYGTNPDESNGASLVPEPAALTVLGVGALAVLRLRRRVA